MLALYLLPSQPMKEGQGSYSRKKFVVSPQMATYTSLNDQMMKTPNELLMLLIQLDSHVKRMHPVHRFVYVQTVLIQLGHMRPHKLLQTEHSTKDNPFWKQRNELLGPYQDRRAKSFTEKPTYG